ncbi:related to TSC13-required for elongation of VLCFA moiety of sphingolipids [Fusarium fujikuroi]|nr:related to TSC13-required for elongation of VLCFA moiety of sphingolipids [Fusarium fujikuroi]SCN69826.1 related to TSC13-required for elongation of VLCFA moiety of sphingolipids [Fusarium fujikuroi]SCN72761.1 related to TSC13-required for elongation of VLCFA moiety of sphingolipids [Fusarium fujikuroi]SCN73359.1 related to TSC13-required for elongation of VLCFA moiety of sphingolipids [Fusarium fujikuroi]SCO29038.1 related to TSC13-required for elongation of VLCFA moiety of sphingolipids [F
MASLRSITLTNRSPRQPIKNLPQSIEVDPDTTVEGLKVLIAKETKLGDFNRIGIYDPTTKKTLKNRKARLVDEPAVVSTGEVLVKDMGYQIAWRTVFVVEYFGPIIFHALAVAARPYIYRNGDGDMSRTQWITFAMIMLHFFKREYETLFVHKFSANTMPWKNIFKNSFFYWAVSGVLCAYAIYHPNSLAAKADVPVIDAVGVALYCFGEFMNALVHQYLSSLRSTGGTERKIPVGYGFGIVTCPNYLYEVLAWVGVILVSRDWTVAFFISIGAAQMISWAKGKERAYRKEFGDKYKKKRYVIFPGLI